MKTIFKLLIQIPIFAGSGALGYYLAKKKYQTLADIEVENVKKTLIDYYEGKNEPKKVAKNESVIENAPKKITQTSSIEPNQTQEDKYTNYSKQYISESVEKKIEAEKEANKKLDKLSLCPYIINEAQYVNSNYISRTLKYYEKDKRLTDEDGRIVDLAEELIGPEAYSIISNGESDVVYVRNEPLEADFEVVLVNKSMFSVPSKERVIPEEYEQ